MQSEPELLLYERERERERERESRPKAIRGWYNIGYMYTIIREKKLSVSPTLMSVIL
jgi:hypothetical protein